MLASKEKSFSLNEIARISGLSPSTAFKEIKDLEGTLVVHDPETKRFSVRETALTSAMRQIFDIEKKLYKTADMTIFDMLSDLGAYYVTGTPAIALRGIGPSTAPATDSLMVICNRKVSKLRGAMMNLFSNYRLLLLEGDVKKDDFAEEKVRFMGVSTKTNLARLERAVVDAIWRPGWEGENISLAFHCLLERKLDAELLKRHARERGPDVEARLMVVVEAIGGENLKKGFDGLNSGHVSKGFTSKVEKFMEQARKNQK